jgi:pyruvate/2-oxoglutarate dehydrogenase complex dihydrolipoamide acyltransferase (E2) component
MSFTPRTAVLFSATFASLLLLSACGKSEAPAPAPAAASTAAPTPAPASPAPAAASTAAMPAAASTAAVSAPKPAATVAAAPAAAPAAASLPLSFSKLTLGNAVNNDHQVIKAGTAFAATDKTIYASVATDGSSTGAKLTAKWSYLEGQGVVVSNITQSIATDGPAITTFKVQNPDLWPEGKYKVEISLDGKSVADQDFKIGKR